MRAIDPKPMQLVAWVNRAARSAPSSLRRSVASSKKLRISPNPQKNLLGKSNGGADILVCHGRLSGAILGSRSRPSWMIQQSNSNHYSAPAARFVANPAGWSTAPALHPRLLPEYRETK